MSRNPEEMIRFFTKMNADEGCVTIAPHAVPFQPRLRDFLEGLKRVPASITAPPGKDPFTLILSRPGRILIMWVPDD